jgi:RNA polymerase primary sigma factor
MSKKPPVNRNFALLSQYTPASETLGKALPEEASTGILYRELQLRPLMDRVSSTAFFEELRIADIEFWTLVLGRSLRLARWWLEEELPAYMAAHTQWFRKGFCFDPKMLKKLQGLHRCYKRQGHKLLKKQQNRYDALLEDFARVLVYKLDGGHRLWEYALLCIREHKAPSAVIRSTSWSQYAMDVLYKDHQVMLLRGLLLESNLRLVLKIAGKQYQRFNGTSPMWFADLFQDGCLGLIEAVNRFDPAQGYAFSTYASHWVLSKMQRGRANSSTVVRRPVHLNALQGHIEKVVVKYKLLHNRYPTDEEILDGAPKGKVTESKLRTARNAPHKFSSLQMKLQRDNEPSDDASATHQDMLLEVYPDPEEFSIYQEVIAALKEAIYSPGILTLQEQKCLVLYYGLTEDTREYTLQEVGEFFGLTRERIRQINMQAIEKLQHYFRQRDIRADDVLPIIATLRNRIEASKPTPSSVSKGRETHKRRRKKKESQGCSQELS